MRELIFEAIIGVLEHERITPQRVLINAKIDYDFFDSNYIDYKDIVDFLQAEVIEKKFLLLESAVSWLESSIAKKYKNVQEVKIEICKIDIFENCKVFVKNSPRITKP